MRSLLAIGLLLSSSFTSSCGGDSSDGDSSDAADASDASDSSAGYARAAAAYVRATCECAVSLGLQSFEQCIRNNEYPEIADGECIERRLRLRAVQTPELEPVIECQQPFWKKQEQCVVDYCTSRDNVAVKACRGPDGFDDQCGTQEQRRMIREVHRECSMLMCADGSTFLFYQRCDGKRECADGSDEDEFCQ